MTLSEEMKERAELLIKGLYDDKYGIMLSQDDKDIMCEYLILLKLSKEQLEKENGDLYEALNISNTYLEAAQKMGKDKSILLDGRIKENKYILQKKGR